MKSIWVWIRIRFSIWQYLTIWLSTWMGESHLINWWCIKAYIKLVFIFCCTSRFIKKISNISTQFLYARSGNVPKTVGVKQLRHLRVTRSSLQEINKIFIKKNLNFQLSHLRNSKPSNFNHGSWKVLALSQMHWMRRLFRLIFWCKHRGKGAEQVRLDNDYFPLKYSKRTIEASHKVLNFNVFQ